MSEQMMHDRNGRKDDDDGREHQHPEPEPEPPGRIVHPRASHGNA